MRVLIIHHEAEYFAGAEKMLGYFLEGLASMGQDVVVAAVPESRTAGVIPNGLETCRLPRNAPFSLRSFYAQLQAVRQAHRAKPFDVIHGWAARDWELTAATSRLTGRPALGTLHDHPRAPFLSRGRQRLMLWSARAGLRKVVCVSEAVRKACAGAGFRREQLLVVRNGLPAAEEQPRAEGGPAFRLGFLGQFSERKGLAGLFEILRTLATLSEVPWEMWLAGDAQEEQGRKLVQQLKQQFSTAAWWPRVQWCGWVKAPAAFLGSLDLLICPSSEFDPFPTVLLEAGRAGLPVLAAAVGGVPEIVADGETGWLFGAQGWQDGARKLRQVIESPGLARRAGEAAKKRVEQEFTMARMLAGYLTVYTDLSGVK
jgi:glycosyltransferase involved in cell wall biosynthesis